MKRAIILAFAAGLCGMACAQQSLWGGQPVVSPEIHADNTVTFRLAAP
ncbi:MAG: esterase, partial [Prevotella sp.]|nr:esterase [Prevotella sp.]